MQELSNHVYIETGYAGVTLGAINWPHGLILIELAISRRGCPILAVHAAQPERWC